MDLENISTFDLIKLIGVIIREVKRRHQKSSEMIRYYDKQLSTLYHTIEFSNFSASKGYKHYSRLKKLLQLRRVVKDESLVVGMAVSRKIRGGHDLERTEALVGHLLNYCDQKNLVRKDEHNQSNYSEARRVFESNYNFSKEID